MNRLDNKDSLELGQLLIKKLVADLEAGDTSSIKTVSKLLLEFEAEVLLICLRQLTLEKMVELELDEDKSFRAVLVKLNTSLEES